MSGIWCHCGITEPCRPSKWKTSAGIFFYLLWYNLGNCPLLEILLVSSVNGVNDKNESYKNIYVCICNWKNIICVWIKSEMLTNWLNVPKAPAKPKHAQCITIFADASANTHTQWEHTCGDLVCMVDYRYFLWLPVSTVGKYQMGGL